MRSAFRMFVLSFLFATAAICRADEMLRISRMVMADQVASSPSAVYPEDAKAAGVEGTVVLDVVISNIGVVEQAVPTSGPDKLRDAAKDAVSKWVYTPYLLDGVATEVDTTVWVEFSLKGGTRNASGDATAVVTDATVAKAAGDSGTPPKVARARLSGGITAGMILHKVAPDYPYTAKMNHVSGAVVMHAIISKHGTIENLEVISGDSMLRDAAMNAVRQWTYKPFLLNGEPTEIDTLITVNFNLARGAAPTAADPNSAGPNGHQIGAGIGPH